MKKLLFSFLLLLAANFVSAQTLVFHENFDPSSNADSVIASGALNNFAINTRLSHSGTKCDSTLVTPNDTAYLTTNSFSTIGYAYVFLNFSHICKIEILDGGEVQVSIDNGVTWTSLSGTQYVNPGNSQFVTNGNKFNSNTYPLDWAPSTGTAKPTNSWWKNESFNISALVGNKSNVKIRFALRDGNGNGAYFNHGWYIDDIKVLASISELTPPVITMIPPVLQDTVFNTGPFDIYAWITDASGINSAEIDYQVNSGSNQVIPMVWISDSTYKGTIPQYTYSNNIDYHVHAVDNSTAHNAANDTSRWFCIKKPKPFVVVGTATSSANVLPANGYYNYSWGAMLYLASELNFSGNIDSIAFYVSSVTSPYTMTKQKVFIGHTAMTSYGTIQPDTSAMTVIYNGTCTFNTTGWYKIAPQLPFWYNGANNLIIYWVNRDGSYVTGYPTFAYTSSPDYKAAYVYNDTYTNVFPTSTGTQTYNRPNLRIKYTSVSYTEDAGVKQVLTPTGTIIAGVNSPVTLLIKNYAVDTLKKAKIAWKLDGVLQTSFNWTGILPEALTSGTINIGNVNVGVGSHIIKAWTELPNDSVDNNFTNDTSSISFYACSSILNGTYTIGPSGNYLNFTDALTALSNCGINGPVIFNVANGTYNEQLNMPVINGISASNTVTFQSSSGNYANVIVQFAASNAGNNFVVKLNGSKYLTFKNMTFQATGTTFSTVVTYSGNSSYISFMGNRLKGVSTTSSTSSDMAVVYSPSGAALPDSVMTFTGNIVEDGSYGFYIYGQGTNANQLENKTIISNNQLINQYYRGIFLYYQNAPQLISNIISTTSTYTGFYAIQCSYCQNNMKVMKNKITLINGGYGVYIYYCSGISGSEGLTANNAISIGGANADYGIYPYYSSFQNIYYNSVNIYANNATATALYLSGAAANVNHKFKNNIFVYTGSNASGRAIYVGTPAMVGSSNYNDLYSTGTNLGYWNISNCATLAAWKTASTRDTNSVSVNPAFISPMDLRTYLSDLNAHATPIPFITDDISGSPRNGTYPDIGAYEFTPPAKNIGMVEILQPTDNCSHPGTDNVIVRLKNNGSANIDTADVYYRINGGTAVHEVMIHTIMSDSSYNYTFTTQANLSTPGTYAFKVYAHLNGDTIRLNDTINKSVTIRLTPPVPVVTNISIPYGTSGILHGTSADSVFWYMVPSGGTAIAMGSNYTTPVLYGNTVYYAEASNAGVNASIGTGTTSEYYIPFYGNYDYGWSSMLYKANEINSVGRIDSIAFYINNAVTAYQVLSQNIFMTETTDTVFPNANKPDPTAMTQVFTGDISWNGPGWFKIALQNPFNYSGNNSLMIYWENEDGSYVSGYPYFNSTSTSGNLAKYKYQDGSFPTVAGTLTVNRPNIKFIANPGCPSARVPDTVFITGIPACDVSVDAIHTPNSGVELTNNELVKVRVKNYGTAPAIKIPIHYVINAGIPVNDTVQGPITTNDTAVFTFATGADLSAFATYNIKVYTDKACDITLVNDTAFKAITNNPLVYCTSIPSNTADEEIFSVTLNGATNAYSCTTVAPGPGSILNEYSNFTTLPPLASLNIGVATPFTIIEDECDGSTYYSNGISIWIDLNRDGDFTDTGEQLFLESATTLGPRTVNGTITVPPGSYVGVTTMRIICAENYSGTGLTPCMTYSYGETEDYSVRISPQIPNNVGVELIRTPTVQAPAGSSKVVKVRIRNYGNNALTSFPVSYAVNMGVPVTETWNGNLASNDTILYSFTTPLIIPAGAFSICAYTGLAADTDHTNDTTCGSITGIPTITVPYSDNFEGPVYFLGLGSGNLWEWGVPSATTIDSAYSPTHAWATNLDGYYTNNANDNLYTPLFNFVPVDSAYLDFYHWYNTQTTSDGCNVQYSVNGGTTWLMLGTQGDLNGVNWYNSAAPGWSGNSGGYVHSRYRLAAIPGIFSATAPVQFRFHFFSDATTNTYDGWAIDNFKITVPQIPNDAGVTKILLPAAATQAGTAVTVKVRLKNYGTNTLTSIPVRYNVDGGAVTSQTWTGSLLTNDTTDFTFTTTFTTPCTAYDLCAFTVLPGDTYKMNDTTCANFGVNPGLHDVGVTKILSPGLNTISGHADTVKVTIKNFGITTETNIPVIYLRNGVTIGAGNYIGSLSAGDTAVYKFLTPNVSPLGNYSLCSKTQFTGDICPLNDNVCIYPSGAVGIEDYDFASFRLMQNAPNPSNNLTSIVFFVPSTDKARFEMVDLLGKVMLTKDMDAVAGKNQVDLDVSKISEGIYFYSVTYQDKKLTKRMVIAK